MLILLLTSPLVWAILSSAKTYCDPSDLVPTLASCDRALIKFGEFVRTAAANKWTFGPSDSSYLRLPFAVVDPKPDDADGNSCAIGILWDPRPWSPRPPLPLPVTELDEVWAAELGRSASRITEKCIKTDGPEQVRQLGHEWIEPLQWVKVDFLSGFGNAAGFDGDLITGDANLTTGTNTTVSASIVNEGNSIEVLTDSGIDFDWYCHSFKSGCSCRCGSIIGPIGSGLSDRRALFMRSKDESC